MEIRVARGGPKSEGLYRQRLGGLQEDKEVEQWRIADVG